MAMEEAREFLPEHNDLTFKAARHGLEFFPELAHILLCETAFFVDLPPEASVYAVPYELRRRGIRRYGGCGLGHQWAWRRVQSVLPQAPRKVITVLLGDRPSLAAIRDGKALDTSIGFTALEGVISATGCGDVDPTIVFLLESSGMSLREINDMLSRRSGFAGLVGRRCGFSELLRENGPAEKSGAREILRYQVLKYIGAYAAVLGGVEAIVFMSEALPDSVGFITGICERLGPLGVRRSAAVAEGNQLRFVTDPSGLVPAVWLEYDRAKVLAEMAGSVPAQGDLEQWSKREDSS